MIDKIFNEDCLEGMKRIPDGTVDAIICDPPFGITNCEFDKRLPFAPMWEQFKRVTKRNAAIVLFSQMPFGAELIMSNCQMFRYEWIVQKDKPCGHLNAKKMPLRCHENILVFYRALPTYNPQMWRDRPYKKRRNVPIKTGSVYNKARLDKVVGRVRVSNGERYPIDVIRGNYNQSVFKEGTTLWAGNTTVHPTQKPVDLLEYLIKTYTNEGEIVLDATIGSGSTAVAAINTGRHFIGFELEEKFFNIANERIAKAYAEKEQRLL